MTVIDDNDIQGHVLVGHRSLHQAALMFRFEQPAALRPAVDLVTTAAELLNKRADDGQDREAGALGLTQRGWVRTLGRLRAIKESYIGSYRVQAPFKSGAYSRSSIVGDEATWLRNWKFGQREQELDGVLILGRSSRAALDTAIAQLVETPGLTIVHREIGQAPPQPREAFGFRDGIQKVSIAATLASGATLPTSTTTHVVEPGWLLLDRSGADVADGDRVRYEDAARDASFLVVRRLRQYPERFTRLVDILTEGHGLDKTRAQLMGRWPSGVSLVDAPAEDPQTPVNSMDFSADLDGKRCPFAAHVRVMRTPEGRPYPIFRRSFSAEGPPRLLFCSYQASIYHQFEKLMQRATQVLDDPPDALFGVPSSLRATPEFGQRSYRLNGPRLRAAAPPVVTEGAVYVIVPRRSELLAGLST